MKDLSCITMDAVDRHMTDLCGTGPVAKGARYHLSTGGTRTRARLGLHAAEALGLSEPVALACACGPELLHNASLVHDDLQDRDVVRRGQPAAWRRFGEAEAVSIGDLMISAAYAAVATHPDPARAVALTHGALCRTAAGQACDLRKARVSVVEYRRMVADKTGALLALPVHLALAAAGAHAEDDALATACGDDIAFAYQALDDIADRRSDLARGRINICALSGPGDTGVAAARRAARDALASARRTASCMTFGAGQPFLNLADRMDSRLTECEDAA